MEEQLLPAIFDEKLQNVAKKADMLEEQNQLCAQGKRLEILEEKMQEVEKRIAAAG